MPADKRIPAWDLSAAKVEPLVEAEAVITLFYHMQSVAPQVWSDLITRTSSATTEEDLEKAVAAWALKWWLFGPAGPTEWALLIGVATARAVLSVPAIQLPPDVDIFICICADPRSSLTHRRIVSARHLIIDIDVARSMFFASPRASVCCQQPGTAPASFRESSSDHRSWFLFSRWCFTLYRRTVRNRFAALRGGRSSATRLLEVAIELAARQFIWSPATDPAGFKLMDKVRTSIGKLRQQLPAASSPMVSIGQPTMDQDRTRNIVWFARHTFGGDSFTKMVRLGNLWVTGGLSAEFE